MVRSEYAKAMKERKREKGKYITGTKASDLGGISEASYGWLGRLGRRACEIDLWRLSDRGRGSGGP